MNTGYFPGVATIGNTIVYVENRDGNANVKTLARRRVSDVQKSTII